MDVSSVASSVLQQTFQGTGRTEGQVEGSTPDGDGDRDDANTVTASQRSSGTTAPSGALGNNLNVTA